MVCNWRGAFVGFPAASRRTLGACDCLHGASWARRGVETRPHTLARPPTRGCLGVSGISEGRAAEPLRSHPRNAAQLCNVCLCVSARRFPVRMALRPRLCASLRRKRCRGDQLPCGIPAKGAAPVTCQYRAISQFL